MLVNSENISQKYKYRYTYLNQEITTLFLYSLLIKYDSSYITNYN